MPYPYTPTPVYTSPVQLASDGDPASSATIMGPIEAALDNIAAVDQLGPRTLRTVDDLAALVALTGMQDGDVVLVAKVTGGPEDHLGLFRFAAGVLSGGPVPTMWEADADDDSGTWVSVDYDRRDVPLGFPTLTTTSHLLVGGSAGTQEIEVGVAPEKVRLYASGGTDGRVAVDGGALFVLSGGQIGVKETATVVLEAPVTPLTQGGVLSVESGQEAFSPGGVHVQSGGAVRVLSGGAVVIDSGATETVSGTLAIAAGGALTLQERIRHEVVRYANGTLNGTPISVTASTADEHILGATPSAPTTIALADPPAVGLRVRFSRDSITGISTTDITVTASGSSYILSSGGGDLRWIELTSAFAGATPTWYPSAYVFH